MIRKNIQVPAAFILFISSLVFPITGCKGPRQYTIGGTVTGLVAGGLVLELNGESTLEVPEGAAEFLFEDLLRNTDSYEVNVQTPPGSGALTDRRNCQRNRKGH